MIKVAKTLYPANLHESGAFLLIFERQFQLKAAISSPSVVPTGVYLDPVRQKYLHLRDNNIYCIISFATDKFMQKLLLTENYCVQKQRSALMFM